MSSNEVNAYKLLLTGPQGSGKTQLAHRYNDAQFMGEYLPTIGVEVVEKDLKLDGEATHAVIWDAAGQERFQSLACALYKGVKVLVAVFDVTSRESFEALPQHLAMLDKCEKQGTPIVLVGNKTDLVAERVVTPEEAQAFADQHGCKLVHTSAKTGEGVREAFTTALKLAKLAD